MQQHIGYGDDSFNILQNKCKVSLNGEHGNNAFLLHSFTALPEDVNSSFPGVVVNRCVLPCIILLFLYMNTYWSKPLPTMDSQWDNWLPTALLKSMEALASSPPCSSWCVCFSYTNNLFWILGPGSNTLVEYLLWMSSFNIFLHTLTLNHLVQRLLLVQS